MPITAYSHDAAGEVDLEQWLTLNQYSIKDDPSLERLPEALRNKAGWDIECSGCRARGALLVAVGRQSGIGRAVSQGHFRFGASGAANPHDPLCDFYFDEKAPRDSEYLVNFASDRSTMTRVIRDLVCRGIRANHFGQADIRRMRLWFLDVKTASSMPLDIFPDLLQWCIEMDATRGYGQLPFQPEHVRLPGFNWMQAIRDEWRLRNRALIDGRPLPVWFREDETMRRARQLVELGSRATVLDPIPLREKYTTVMQFAEFASLHVYLIARTEPPAYARLRGLKGAGRSLLALCALLLFVHAWDIGRASAMFANVSSLPSAAGGLEGNVMGLNPFHDYEVWEVIHEARRIASLRGDTRYASGNPILR